MTGHPDREQRVSAAFLEIIDAMVDDLDVIDLLDRLTTHCVALLAVDSAGVLLGDARNRLRLAAASDHHARTTGLLQLQADDGPCLDCWSDAVAVCAPDLREAAARWPAFVAAAGRAGTFRSVHALPLRLRGRCVGAVSLFCRAPGPLPVADLALAQALADVATAAMLQRRATDDAETLAVQLQTALDNRVVIEQAKGVLAAGHGWTIDAAFQRMRRHARTTHQRLAVVAGRIVAGELDLTVATRPARGGSDRA